jgi:hypothetical protein
MGPHFAACIDFFQHTGSDKDYSAGTPTVWREADLIVEH